MPLEYAEAGQRSNIERELIEYAIAQGRISEANDRANGVKVTVRQRPRSIDEYRAELRSKARTWTKPVTPPRREGPLHRYVPTRT